MSHAHIIVVCLYLLSRGLTLPLVKLLDFTYVVEEVKEDPYSSMHYYYYP
jgi:hypothetical protein